MNMDTNKPECMKMELPFSNTYVKTTKIRNLRKNLREIGFSEADQLLIMKKRRLLRCKEYVWLYRERQKQIIEELKKQKIKLDLERDSLIFSIEEIKNDIERIGMN
ncbi:hypothetical protein LOD99_16179 [Oopsacas minuta]|uniref:Uncharacterized protein n=1 Tax=Oopsacas minuta TaxID=111878 RepID=A0AAV7K9B4_9METZ|nr:hypothetical protein LOD99_16179 [Oopsacas minuta]